MSGYRYKAKPTWINGVLYASRLEARCATLLHEFGIEFEPHVKFDLWDRNGKRFTHFVDFLLLSPQKLLGVGLVDALETKGILTKHDLLRCDALEYCHGVRCWIVLEGYIALWEREGLFKNKG